jgi:hypothetical protein
VTFIKSPQERITANSKALSNCILRSLFFDQIVLINVALRVEFLESSNLRSLQADSRVIQDAGVN